MRARAGRRRLGVTRGWLPPPASPSCMSPLTSQGAAAAAPQVPPDMQGGLLKMTAYVTDDQVRGRVHAGGRS
eukprot:365008-Chlamydomonas_euryale.AAC.1